MSSIFLDTTLRDGEQRPGVSFTRRAKLTLARGLDAWGVGIIEAGIPAMGRAERATLESLLSLGLRAEVLVWNRLTEEDLALCLAAGYPAVHFSVPTSDIMLAGKLGKDRAWVLDQIDRVVGKAAASGCKVSLGAEDASRSDLSFLRTVFDRAVAAGAQRVRYADTLGLLTPDRTTREISLMTWGLPVPLDFHGHDDFGLATANTLAAHAAGAQVLSCSLLGLGERAGNAALEEVAGILGFLSSGGRPADPRFPGLVALCRLAAGFAGVDIPAHKPLVGEAVFSHQSGIHVDGLLKDPRTYEAWPPEAFGGRRQVLVGKHSGSTALRHLAARRGVDLDEASARQFLEDLREAMGARPGIDPAQAFEHLISLQGVR